MLKALVQCSSGLALFLWGLQWIKKDFQQIVNSKIHEIVSLLTINFTVAVVTGLIITTIIQSSSAAIIIIISLVNLKLLDFHQAVGVVVGANIATTITVQLISFNLTKYLGIMLMCGFFLYALHYLIDLNFIRYWGQGLTVFGVLLWGLELLSSSLAGLEDSVWLMNVISYLSNWPLAGLLVGVIITVIVQSSSAVTGLIVALAKQNLIILETAVTIALGSNIGTCITGFLAGLGGTPEAKLTAWAHLYFNLLGVLIFLPLLPSLVYIVEQFSFDLSRQIANAHTLFNVLTALIIFFFRDKFTTLIYKLHH